MSNVTLTYEDPTEIDAPVGVVLTMSPRHAEFLARVVGAMGMEEYEYLRSSLSNSSWPSYKENGWEVVNLADELYRELRGAGFHG